MGDFFLTPTDNIVKLQWPNGQWMEVYIAAGLNVYSRGGGADIELHGRIIAAWAPDANDSWVEGGDGIDFL